MKGIAADDAMCFLWVTNSHLHQGFHVLEAWGFEYKTAITWAKNKFGLGYWMRGQTEHILFGIRGNPREAMVGPHGATGKNWSTLFTAPIEEHSRKPRVVYKMVEDMGPPPRVELFARSRRNGWDAWGDQVPDPEDSMLFRLASEGSG